ncbi:MAG: plasmid transfer protein [Bacteroidetes bacterium]|nr:plasmid transfer protein [Bacteroidota bacterium]
MQREFQVYKGLQRPLVYRGFKGKFIYWGVGALLAGLVLGAVTMALVNMWLGLIVLIAAVGGGLVFIAAKQKQGLHPKARAQGIFIHQPNFKRLHHYARKTNI